MFRRTLILITISLFQLSFFGLLPREIKILGDILFICLIIYLVIKYSRYLKENNANINGAPKFPKYFTLLFFLYVIFQILYSCVLWGEPLYVLQEGRRWFIAALYFYLIVSGYSILFDYKIITKFIYIMSFVIIINVLLLKAGINFPSAESTWQEQGGILVFKPFVPGSFILYIAFVYSTIRTFTYEFSVKRRLFNLFLSFILLVINITLIPFRAWVICSLFAVIISLLIFYFSLLKIKSMLRWVFLFSSISFVIIYTGFASNSINWISSAFVEEQSMEGDYLVRYLRDVSKLEILNAREIYLIDGIGFVHRSSEAAEQIGFSSETNDTGWVEILLTGGLVGTIVFFMFYLSVLIYFAKLFISLKYRPFLGLLSVWITAGLLFISSNLLLWDFGFIPISLATITILSKYNQYEENNNSW